MVCKALQDLALVTFLSTSVTIPVFLASSPPTCWSPCSSPSCLAYSCLRAFALTIPLAWNSCPPDRHRLILSSSSSLCTKVTFSVRPFLRTPFKLATLSSPLPYSLLHFSHSSHHNILYNLLTSFVVASFP